MPTPRDNLVGIGLMMVSSLLFIGNDTIAKLLGTKLFGAALPLGEIIFLRGIVSTAAILVLIVALGEHRRWRAALHPLVALRSIGEAGATGTYMTALFHMPIANATTILQMVPLTTTAAGALLLRDHVGWRRWTAIAVGFVGMLIVVRPGFAGFDAFALLCLAAVAFITMRDLVTRQMPAAISAPVVSAIGSAALLATGAALGLGEDWRMPSAWEVAGLVAAGLLIAAAFLTLILSLRTADMATVAPFRYTQVVWAMILGYLVWHDMPDGLTLLGTALIIATGVYTFYRERQVARRRGEAPVTVLRPDNAAPEI